MAFDSQINTGLPETPDVNNPHDYAEFLRIYNAIRSLQTAIENQQNGNQGSQGPQGPAGTGGNAVPLFIAEDEAFTIEENTQVLFSYPITLQGIIICNGILKQVT